MAKPSEGTCGAVAWAEPSDHSLLQRFRRGSEDAATQLYLRYVQRLQAVARAQCSADLVRRVDIDDIVQSVFGSFFRRARQGYYDVPPGEQLWRLLVVIAINKIRAQGAFHRAAKRDVGQTTGIHTLDRARAPAVRHDETAYAFLQWSIAEALEPFPPVYQTMLELRIQGYEVTEIAQRTGRSRRTVERILQEVRKELANVLREND